MKNKEGIIERCKQEILYRANYMRLPFDNEDIEHFETEDGYIIVALMRIKQIRIVPESLDVVLGPNPPKCAEAIEEKTPNIYLFWPRERHKIEVWGEKVFSWLPLVRVRFPMLVYIIFPDGSIKKGDDTVMLMHQQVRKETRGLWEIIKVGIEGGTDE